MACSSGLRHRQRVSIQRSHPNFHKIIIHLLFLLLLSPHSLGYVCYDEPGKNATGPFFAVDNVFGSPFYICKNISASCWGRCHDVKLVNGLCRCDEACQLYQDCCIDYERICIRNASITVLPALTTSEIEAILHQRMSMDFSSLPQKQYFSCSAHLFTKKPFSRHMLTVTLCPDDSLSTLKSQCENQSEGLKYNIPVLGKYLLYKNMFCAKCHAEVDYDPLKVRFYSHNESLVEQANDILWLNEKAKLVEFMQNHFEYTLDPDTRFQNFASRLECDLLPEVNDIQMFPEYTRHYAMPVIYCNNSEFVYEAKNPSQLFIKYPELAPEGMLCGVATVMDPNNGIGDFLVTFKALFNPVQETFKSIQSSNVICNNGEMLDAQSGKCLKVTTCTERTGESPTGESGVVATYYVCHYKQSEKSVGMPSNSHYWTLVLIYETGQAVLSKSDINYYFHIKNKSSIHLYHKITDAYFMTMVKFIGSPQDQIPDDTYNIWEQAETLLRHLNIKFFSIDLYTYDIDSLVTCMAGTYIAEFPGRFVYIGPRNLLYMYNLKSKELYNMAHVQLDLPLYNVNLSVSPLTISLAKTCLKPISMCSRKWLSPKLYLAINDSFGMASLLLSNGDILIENEFQVMTNNDSFEVWVCTYTWDKLHASLGISGWHFILVVCGTVSSVTGLIITIVTISCIDKLRTSPGLIILHLSIMLLLAQITHSLTKVWAFNSVACQVMAAWQHLLWLLVFGWTGLLAWDMKRTFLELSTEPPVSIVSKYCALVWSSATGVVAPCLFLSFFKWPIYGLDDTCWLTDKMAFIVSFMTPVCLTITWNAILFTRVTVMLRKAMGAVRNISNREKSDEVMIYFRISSLLGFNWVIGIIATFVDEPWLWIVFDVVNPLQGVGIFLAIVVRKRVFHLYRMIVMEHSNTTRVT